MFTIILSCIMERTGLKKIFVKINADLLIIKRSKSALIEIDFNKY